MSILKTDSKRKGYKLVGISVPTNVHNYLTLFTLSRGITKSDLFKVLIEDWKKEAETNEKELIQELAIRINNEWQDRKKEHPRATFNEFTSSLQKELFSKGLYAVQIESLLRQIKG